MPTPPKIPQIGKPRALNLNDMFQRGYMVPRPSPPPAIALDARPRSRARTAAPVRPNLGLEVAYRRKLLKLVDEMATSVAYWVKRTYAANEPEMAMDSMFTSSQVMTKAGPRWVAYVNGEPLLGPTGKPRLFKTQAAAEKAALSNVGGAAAAVGKVAKKRTPLPAKVLQKSIDELADRWQAKFDESANDLARYFSTSVFRRTDAALKTALDKGGWTVELRMTPAARDLLAATTQQNIQLIKTIPQQYLAGVQGDVMRSVQAGRDLASLSKDLQSKYGVTRRRAALIARSQNNIATATITRARQGEIGITEAVWVHSSAGKEPRPTHVKNDGKRYSVARGWFDPAVGEYIWPGTLINCRCFSKSVIPGFD